MKKIIQNYIIKNQNYITKENLMLICSLNMNTITVSLILKSQLSLKAKFYFICTRYATYETKKLIALSCAEIMLNLYAPFTSKQTLIESIQAAREFLNGVTTIEILRDRRAAALIFVSTYFGKNHFVASKAGYDAAFSVFIEKKPNSCEEADKAFDLAYTAYANAYANKCTDKIKAYAYSNLHSQVHAFSHFNIYIASTAYDIYYKMDSYIADASNYYEYFSIKPLDPVIASNDVENAVNTEAYNIYRNTVKKDAVKVCNTYVNSMSDSSKVDALSTVYAADCILQAINGVADKFDTVINTADLAFINAANAAYTNSILRK